MKHRTFRPEKLFKVVEPEQLTRLLEMFEVSHDDATRLTLDEAAFKSFFDEPNELPLMAELEEETQRINDISEATLRFVVDEYTRQEIDFNPEDSPERLALRMYLDFPSVFEAAWNNYALFGTSSDLASYKLVPGLVVTEGLVETLGDSLRAYFSSQAKGEHYQVFWSENAGGAVLRIDHGLHMQTLRFWDDGRPRYQSLRPAKDDVVFYERTAGLLHVRASLDADRDEYLRLFARDIAGDEELAKVASSQPLYTLMPLALGRFSFAGDSDQVTSVDLRHLRLTLDLNPPTVISVTSRDALASLASLRPLSLSSGAPLEARFRFNLWPGGSRTTSVTVSVKPPSRTRITQAKYGEIIDRYLEAQGVRIP